MSPRLLNTKWLLSLLITIWEVHSVILHQPPLPAQQKVAPAAKIEDQAKFFQYMHSPSAEDYDQGHRQGTEQHFTERHERYRPATGLFSAKVRWGDKQGGYGEHYWDLNHAGHADNHGHNDEGYDRGYNDSDDSYDEPSENSPQYESSEESLYDQDSKYDNDDGNRNKRAHKKTKVIKETNTSDNDQPKEDKLEKDHFEAAYSHNIEKVKYDKDDNINRRGPNRHKQRKAHKPDAEEPEERNKERLQRDYTHNVEKTTEHIEDVPKQQKRKRSRVRTGESKDNIKEQPKVKDVPSEEDDESYEEDYSPYEGKVRQNEPQNYNQKYANYDQKPRQQEQSYVPQQNPPAQLNYEHKYVPYEQGSGVRQHHHPELAAAASIPRLFWEPTTGHVVDRATGQAYVLQPIQL